jgi:hypothetical protein
MSFEEVMERDVRRLEEYGFFVVAVEPRTEGDPSSAWAYTVGLVDNASHPELIVAGGDPMIGGRLLQTLGVDVLSGARFTVGDTIAVGPHLGTVGAVHPVQYQRDTFNMWHEMNEAGHLSGAPLSAVQIKDAHAFFCLHHRHQQPDLSRVDSRVGEERHMPNRAARRARERRKRRS